MSFFGFDPNKPPQAAGKESYDFQDTYDGLEEVDVLNDQTFGDVSQSWLAAAPLAVPAPAKPSVLYAQAAQSHPQNDDEFMADLWGADKPTGSQTAASVDQEKKVLLLSEIEAQLAAIDQTQPPLTQQQQPGQFGAYPPPQSQQQFMYPPQGYMPPHGYPPVFQQFPPGQQPGQFFPPQQYPGQYVQFPGQPGLFPPPMQFAPQQQQQMHQFQQHQQPPVPGPGPGPAQAAVQAQAQALAQIPTQSATPTTQNQVSVAAPIVAEQKDVSQNQVQPEILSEGQEGQDRVTSARRKSRVDPLQFPVLGSKGEPHQARQPPAELTPEQQQKLARRHEKVSRIMKYSGIMTPRDKDFVTRFQLSQIVTDDPYNEDFYAQVFKVVHPKNIGANLQDHATQNNSIAQAYLDHSGHRLGGRYNKADLALQRMQQQVQRAVTVAKERPKLTEYAREGSLGRISVVSGKKPRQQLELFSQAAKKEIEKQEKAESEARDGDDSKTAVKKKRLPLLISVPLLTVSSGPKIKYTSKDIMGILENIISKLMELESQLRIPLQHVDTSELWISLNVLSQPSTSGAHPQEVNPFIQCLNHKKALKILPRLFKFLSREQILTIVTLVLSNLENLTVIKQGSYTTYEDKKVPASVLGLVETYSLTFLKVLMNAVQDFKFNEIIGLLVILIEHNNVSFVSTTKIGLSILTTLLLRAELIKGEGTISATDLSEWSSCYDELFTSLELRIASIFPPHPDDVDDGSLSENYVWQFLATLSLGGKLNHQRIIVDEVRDQIFGVMNRAKAIDNSDLANAYKKQNLLNNLNMYLVVMGLVADENEIKELS